MKKYLPILLVVAVAFPSFVMAQALINVAISTSADSGTTTPSSTTAIDLASTATTTATTTIGLEATSTGVSTISDNTTDGHQISVTTSTPTAELGTTATSTALNGIIRDEDQYFAEHGEYLPILPNNRLLSKESGTIEDKLGHTIAPDASVDVYDGPHGKGYRVVYVLGNKRYSVGYGPDAAAFTFTTDLPASAVATSASASSTAASLPTDASTDTTTSQTASTSSRDASTTVHSTDPVSTTAPASTTPITLPDAPSAVSSSATSTQ